jgi:PPOX class probable F420-dependent enzyme
MADEDEDELWALVAGGREGILATIGGKGRPQLSNILYVVDDPSRTVRISTTADRVKARNLVRDPRASLHVGGDDFWHFAVAEGSVTLSETAAAPDDEAVAELRAVHGAFYADLPDARTFGEEMVAARRLVIRLQVDHLYGIMAPGGRRPRADDEPT